MKKSYFLLTTLSVFFFSFCADTKKSQIPVATEVYSDAYISRVEKDVFNLINKHRQSIGLQPLKWMSGITDQAEIHSSDMALRKTGFGHEGFETRYAKLQKAIGNVHAGAENVAYGTLTAEQVTKGWLGSPGHKKNIEGDYNLTGIGVAVDKQGLLFFTQIFLKQ
ncbi:CAP domain-containing protein [Chitinophagaceae bacterium LWZ2-11]